MGPALLILLPGLGRSPRRARSVDLVQAALLRSEANLTTILPLPRRRISPRIQIRHQSLSLLKRPSRAEVQAEVQEISCPARRLAADRWSEWSASVRRRAF